MALHRLVINTNLTATQDAANMRLNGTGSYTNVARLVDWLRGFVIGNRTGNMLIKVGAVQATGLVTFTGAPTADETVTIGNVVFTAKDSGATGNQFNIGGSVTATALNLATAINASANLTGKITASPNLGVVTLTSVVPGLIGNALALSESMSNTTVTAFASGTDGTAYNMTLGKAIS